MLKPGTEEYFRTGEVTANGDSTHFLNNIKGFYKQTTGLNPEVTRELFDVDGNVLPETSTDFVSQTISVKATKLLN